MYVACEGLSDLGHGPNKPTATTIGEYSASLQDGALILSLVRGRISGSDKNLATSLATHHCCMTGSYSVYVAYEGMSDLGNEPNKPSATTNGECSASLQGGALILSLVRAKNSGSAKNLATSLATHHCCMTGS